jgi:uncharacterized membrane protein YiaA
MNATPQKPSTAFVLASWAALFAGMIAYLVGLWNAGMPLSEKGYYFTVLMYGLFSAVSVQKSVRDQLETLLLSEKGFYGMAFVLAMFAAVTVQKNTRDLAGSGAAGEPAPRFRWPSSTPVE